MIDFNLPRTRFVDDSNDLFDQFHFVVSECKEVGLELGCKLEIHCDSRNAPLLEDFRQQDLDFIAHEAVDLMQAVQTLLHMLAEKHGVDVQKVIAEVVKKNNDKGYYNTD